MHDGVRARAELTDWTGRFCGNTPWDVPGKPGAPAYETFQDVPGAPNNMGR